MKKLMIVSLVFAATVLSPTLLSTRAQAQVFGRRSQPVYSQPGYVQQPVYSQPAYSYPAGGYRSYSYQPGVYPSYSYAPGFAPAPQGLSLQDWDALSWQGAAHKGYGVHPRGW